MNNFNYDNINDTHKEVVTEIMNLARDSGMPEFANFIQHKFKIVEPTKMTFKDTEFVKACDKQDIRVWLMGWVQDGGGSDPSAPYWPVISITEDVRKLQKLVDALKND